MKAMRRIPRTWKTLSHVRSNISSQRFQTTLGSQALRRSALSHPFFPSLRHQRRRRPCISSAASAQPRSFSTIPPPSTNSSRPAAEPSPKLEAKELAVESEQQTKQPLRPSYDITFTCRPCDTRSTHRISKHGYHSGSVLITCPSCTARHVISDHLKIFVDYETDIELLMKEKGELVKRGRIGKDGTIEYWNEDQSVDPTSSPKADSDNLLPAQ